MATNRFDVILQSVASERSHRGMVEARRMICFRQLCSATILIGVAISFSDAILLNATLVFSRPQKYLILGETTSDDFLRCEGGDSTKSLKINLLQNGIDITSSNVGRYSFSCAPEEADSTFVHVDKASCAFGIKSVKATDAGRYTCRVQSLQQGQTKTKQTELRIFDKFILAPTNNPKEITLSTSEPFSLSCRINQQKYTADLNVEWRRSGYAVDSAKVSNTLDNPFTYAVSSAQQNNAGVYRCVIRSVNDGDVVIDSGNSTTVNIKFTSLPYLSSIPFTALNYSVVTLDYYADDTLICVAQGYPVPRITLTHNNETVPLKQKTDNTITLKISSATQSDAGRYCCSDSNGHEMCLTVNVKDVPLEIQSFGTVPKKDHCFDDADIELECLAKGKPSPWVSIRDPRGKPIGVSGTERAWVCLNRSLAIGGVYHCRANNSVWSEMSNITIPNTPTNLTVDFREMTHSNEMCFPEGSSVALCCTASADGDRLVTEILSSKGTVINSTIGVKNKICAVVSTPGVYTCIASTRHIFFERTLTVCMYPDDAFVTSVIVSCVVIGALLLVLLFVLVKCRRRNFFSRRRNFLMRFDEKKPLLSSPKTQDKQIEIVSDVITPVWPNVFRAMEPPLNGKSKFVDSILKKARNSNRDDAYWAAHCLQIWNNENPGRDFLMAVYNAVENMGNSELAERLCNLFPTLSIEVSSEERN